MPSRLRRLAPPTRSFSCVPTRLLVLVTGPVIAVLALAQVMAPAAVSVPPPPVYVHSGLRMAMPPPLPTFCRPPLPTRSPSVTPTRLLAEPSTPVVLPSRLNQVTAPLAALQLGLNTSALPLLRSTNPPLPTKSLAAPPTKLLLALMAPTSGSAAALSTHVTAPLLPCHDVAVTT